MCQCTIFFLVKHDGKNAENVEALNFSNKALNQHLQIYTFAESILMPVISVKSFINYKLFRV